MRFLLLLAALVIACQPMPSSTLVADGMATWWLRPLWSEVDGYLYGSVVDSNGKVLALKVNVGDLSVQSVELGDHEKDDHNAASHVVPTDQPPIFFYQRHNVDSVARYRIGSAGPGVLTFGSVQTISFAGIVSYTQTWRRPGTDEIHLFVRDGNRYWSNAYSSGWGTGWSTPRRVFDFGATDLHYITTVPLASDPSILRIAAYGHPFSSSIHDIRAGLIDLDTGNVTTVAGSVLGNLKTGSGLPIGFTALDLAVDTPSGHLARMYAIGDGPLFEIAYSDWDDEETDSMYRMATLDGSWSSSDIVASGDPFALEGVSNYYGGMSIPRDTPGGVVYSSRQAGGEWIIEKWSKDGTWAAEQLARDTDLLVRPWTVERPSSVRVLWHVATSYYDGEIWEGGLVAFQRREAPSAVAGVASSWPSFRP